MFTVTYCHILSLVLAGYYDLPVEALKEPSWLARTRDADEKHIQDLQDEFRKKPYNYFTVMAVNIANLEPKNFEFDKINSYVLQTIGGNHSRIALQNLLSEELQEASIKHIYAHRVCAVYCNLTTDQAKRIGTEHNAIHDFAMKDSFSERVMSFRISLLEKAGYKNSEDLFSKETPTDQRIHAKWKTGLEISTGVGSVSWLCVLVSIVWKACMGELLIRFNGYPDSTAVKY